MIQNNQNEYSYPKLKENTLIFTFPQSFKCWLFVHLHLLDNFT